MENSQILLTYNDHTGEASASPSKELIDHMLGSMLDNFYGDYTLFFRNSLFRDNGYYVIRESGRVVAGLHTTFQLEYC